MAAPRGKTAEEAKDAVKDAPIVADLHAPVAGVQAGANEVLKNEDAPLSQEERQGALANLLGPAVVAPAIKVEGADDQEVKAAVEAALADVEPLGDGLVTATVLFDRFQYNPGTGWVSGRQGATIRLPEAQASRGIRLGGLKVNG